MTEEEYFRKNHPDSCYGDKPLSPHWDFFQDGVEFGERQSEKKITDLEKENAEYKEVFGSCDTCKRSCDMGNCCDPRTKNGYLLDRAKIITERQKLLKENTELKNRNQELLESCEGATMMYKDLQKANEIIKKYLAIGVGGKITQNYLDVTKEAEQFLKEIKEK